MSSTEEQAKLRKRIEELERANIELKHTLEEHSSAGEAKDLERDQLEQMLDATVDGICLINRRNEIQYVNPALEKQFGVVDGRKCFQYLHNSNAACPSCRSEEVFAGKCVRSEEYIAAVDRTYHIFGAPLRNADGTLSMLEILHDATEYKKAQEALIESEKKLRALSFELLAAQETERRRISKELHDGLGQALTVMKLKMGFIERKLRPDQDDLKGECEGTLRYIDQVIENARRMSRDLSPSILEDLGLSAALRRLAEEFMRLHEIDFVIEMDRIDHLISEKARIVLYRIVQEALTNIEKHAQAKKARLTIRREQGRVLFEIEDDGRGFEVTQALAAENGLGLATINERVRMLGGLLKLRSRAGIGTRLSFAIPVQVQVQVQEGRN